MMQKKKTIRTVRISCPTWYSGNLFFLILFLIIWLPVGILLLMKNGAIIKENSRLYLNYHGKWGWLLFWGILFFPVSILLLLIKGVDVIEEETLIEEELIIDQL